MNLEIYSKDWCPYCKKAKALLKAENISYTEIDVTQDPEREQEMIERSGRRTVPQIFLDGQSLGGFDDLAVLRSQGPLNDLLGTGAANSQADPAVSNIALPFALPTSITMLKASGSGPTVMRTGLDENPPRQYQ